jgi:hypothetical protein
VPARQAGTAEVVNHRDPDPIDQVRTFAEHRSRPAGQRGT